MIHGVVRSSSLLLLLAAVAGCPREGVPRYETPAIEKLTQEEPARAEPTGDEALQVEPTPDDSEGAAEEFSHLDEAPPREGAELLGTRAPEWETDLWINSDPLKLSELRGQVVLVRFWTDTCPFCEASAPALARLHSSYASKGLKVIGIYHPKPPRDEPVASVKAAAKRLGMEFPIALDNEWRTLRRYWFGQRRGYTSVSFLIDKEGKIRHIHPGPEFHPDPSGDHPSCDEDYRRMESWVRRLLEESPG